MQYSAFQSAGEQGRALGMQPATAENPVRNPRCWAVHGAGSEVVNGLYQEGGTNEGKPFFDKVEPGLPNLRLQFQRFGDDGIRWRWQIADVTDPLDRCYYSSAYGYIEVGYNWGLYQLPPADGWGAHAPGAEPAPSDVTER